MESVVRDNVNFKYYTNDVIIPDFKIVKIS